MSLPPLLEAVLGLRLVALLSVVVAGLSVAFGGAAPPAPSACCCVKVSPELLLCVGGSVWGRCGSRSQGGT